MTSPVLCAGPGDAVSGTAALNQAEGVLAFLGLKSVCKTDEKQISVVLMGEEEFRFSLLNRLLSFGGCQDPHCAPEVGPVKGWVCVCV